MIAKKWNVTCKNLNGISTAWKCLDYNIDFKKNQILKYSSRMSLSFVVEYQR